MSLSASGTGVQKTRRIGGVDYGLNTIRAKRKGRAGHPRTFLRVFNQRLNGQNDVSNFDTTETKASKQRRYLEAFKPFDLELPGSDQRLIKVKQVHRQAELPRRTLQTTLSIEVFQLALFLQS